MKGALVTVEIVSSVVGAFANQFNIESEKPYNSDKVGRELLWAILCSLLCPETDWNISAGKQGYVFILTDFLRSDDLMFIPDINLWEVDFF